MARCDALADTSLEETRDGPEVCGFPPAVGTAWARGTG